MNPQVFSKFLTKKWKNRQSSVIISGGKKLQQISFSGRKLTLY